MTTQQSLQFLLSKQQNPKLVLNFQFMLKALSIVGSAWAKPPETKEPEDE